MAERLGNWAINQKVAGLIPGCEQIKLCPWARHFTLLASGGMSLYLVLESLWIRASAKLLNVNEGEREAGVKEWDCCCYGAGSGTENHGSFRKLAAGKGLKAVFPPSSQDAPSSLPEGTWAFLTLLCITLSG